MPEANNTGPQQDATGRVSVGDAAAQLGVTPDAIRARIRRGSLPADKVDGAWYVHAADLPRGTQQDIDTTQQEADRRRQDVIVGTVALVDQLRGEISRLDRDIDDLRTRLDWSQGRQTALGDTLADVITQAADDRKRADTLQAMNQHAQDRIRELEALTVGMSSESEAAGSPETIDNVASSISTGMPPGSVWRRLWRAITVR